MSGYLRLSLSQNLDEITHTNLLIPHQVEKAEPGLVAQCLEEALHVERSGFCLHDQFIRLDEYIGKAYSRFWQICSSGGSS